MKSLDINFNARRPVPTGLENYKNSLFVWNYTKSVPTERVFVLQIFSIHFLANTPVSTGFKKSEKLIFWRKYLHQNFFLKKQRLTIKSLNINSKAREPVQTGYKNYEKLVEKYSSNFKFWEKEYSCHFVSENQFHINPDTLKPVSTGYRNNGKIIYYYFSGYELLV